MQGIGPAREAAPSQLGKIALQHNGADTTARAGTAGNLAQRSSTQQPPKIPFGAKALANFSRLVSVETFFRLWEEGDSFTGKSAVKHMPVSERRGEGKRFYEWRKAGEAIERRAKAGNLSPTEAAAQAETERLACKMPVAKFLKEVLGKE